MCIRDRVWLVTYLPLVLLWAVILAVVVWLVLRLVRRAQKAGKLPKVCLLYTSRCV